MNELTKSEMIEVIGGGFKLTIGSALVIGGIISFVIGAVNGYLRPLTCKSEK